MTTKQNGSSGARYFLPLCLFAAFSLGAYWRLDQVLSQVLVADEWHAVHQLTYYSPSHVVRSFGYADHSIPLVLWYFLLMNWFEISEIVLRAPMLVAGILTVIAFPWALRRRLDDRTVALLALLLAISPFLISYSRIGRPYAVTVFGLYLAYWCLDRAVSAGTVRWRFAAAYAVLCGLVVWTHPITGLMLGAPLLAIWWGAVRGTGLAWPPVLKLTALTAVMMAFAVLPPVLGDPAALAGKSGIDSINLDTVYGASFMWFGVGWPAVVAAGTVLAALGCATVWRSLPIARWAALGIGLTVVALLVLRPWWIDKPLALGRYLLPVVPLLLLMVAAGIVRVADRLVAFMFIGRPRAHPAVVAVLAAPYVAGAWLSSPMPETLAQPNSYAQDVYFQYDYRKEVNAIRIGFPWLPGSPVWASLAVAPADTLTVAVAPFRYATHEWPAPLWERASGQRVVPAYLWGACEKTRHGEVPPDARFRFRNAVHVVDREKMLRQGVDYLVYYTPVSPGLSPPLPHCEAWVREHYGPPDYEDGVFLFWRLNPAAPRPTAAKVTL